MSNFNHCRLVWHLCGEVTTKKIEKIQDRALRVIYQDYTSSYDTLLIKSQLPSFRVRRGQQRWRRLKSNQTPVYLSDLLLFKSHSHSFRYTNTVEVSQVRTSTYGVRSFRSTAAKMWNSLPQQFREITTVEQCKDCVSMCSNMRALVCVHTYMHACMRVSVHGTCLHVCARVHKYLCFVRMISSSRLCFYSCTHVS